MYDTLVSEKRCINCLYLEDNFPRCTLTSKIIIPERRRECDNYAAKLSELLKCRQKATKRRKSS